MLPVQPQQPDDGCWMPAPTCSREFPASVSRFGVSSTCKRRQVGKSEVCLFRRLLHADWCCDAAPFWHNAALIHRTVTLQRRAETSRYLEHQLLEGLCDCDVCLGAGLHKEAAVRLCKVLPLLRRHLPVCVLLHMARRQCSAWPVNSSNAVLPL